MNIMDDYKEWFNTDEWKFAINEITKSNMLPYPVSSKETIRKASETLREFRGLPQGIAMDLPSPLIMYDEENRKFILFDFHSLGSHLPCKNCKESNDLQEKLERFFETGGETLSDSKHSGKIIYPLSFRDALGELLEVADGDVVAIYDEYDDSFSFSEVKTVRME